MERRVAGDEDLLMQFRCSGDQEVYCGNASSPPEKLCPDPPRLGGDPLIGAEDIEGREEL